MIEPQCQLNVIHFQFSEVYVFTTFPSPWVSYGFGFPAAELSGGSPVLVLRAMSPQSALSLSLITSHLTSGPQRGF